MKITKNLEHIFPPATLPEIIEARKKYPYKTWSKILQEEVNKEELKNK